ncbi:hypothetical protein WA026_011558 [Henosepilachna vigintioctopunctata]|uniref:Uncharacterized protein n=1 Tax=Henosepilachna vigintioctopunctata TaxID=420089 RepID=A0AAW1TRJ0_9CUCU
MNGYKKDITSFFRAEAFVRDVPRSNSRRRRKKRMWFTAVTRFPSNTKTTRTRYPSHRRPTNLLEERTSYRGIMKAEKRGTIGREKSRSKSREMRDEGRPLTLR